MPELPEVEVVRAGLAPFVTGATVSAVQVHDQRSLRRHRGPAEDFVDRLTGAGLVGASRRGKYLWLPLAPGPGLESGSVPPDLQDAESQVAARRSDHPGSEPREALVVHLGMSGQVLARPAGTEDRLTRIRLDLDDGTRINFVDQRIFGSMAIDPLVAAPDAPGERIPASVRHIARDPLDPRFDDRAFLRRLAAKRTTVKRALLDQTLISGIGNIYADEALWAARIHYDQPTERLSAVKARALLAEVRAVLGKALAEGGTSFDAQYRNVNGEAGYFEHSLNAYGRHGLPCPRCGRPMVRDRFMNRGSHYCPSCQRIR